MREIGLGITLHVSVNHRVVRATPDQVWSVLADGWLYPLWVVGATRMREVDDSWPAPGARLHHSVGVWPAVLDDETRVLESEPRRFLHLRAAAWPTGEAQVRITLAAQGPGTRVEIEEDAREGPARLVPGLVRHPLIKVRNTETLCRLALLAEGRAAS